MTTTYKFVGHVTKEEESALKLECSKCKKPTYLHGHLVKLWHEKKNKEVRCSYCFEGTVPFKNLKRDLRMPKEQLEEIRKAIPGFDEEDRDRLVRMMAK